MTIVTVKLTASQFDAIRAVIARDRVATANINSEGLNTDARRALAKRIFELDTLEQVFG